MATTYRNDYDHPVDIEILGLSVPAGETFEVADGVTVNFAGQAITEVTDGGDEGGGSGGPDTPPAVDTDSELGGDD